MKKLSALGVLAVLTVSTLVLAKPVEDGSSFTGTYVVQETACYSPSNPYSNLPPDTFIFEGTPYGLKINGSLIPLMDPTTNDHGGGVVTSVATQYVSSSEFTSKYAITTPAQNNGQTQTTVNDYVVDAYGNVVLTETATVGCNAPTVTYCHFQRQN